MRNILEYTLVAAIIMLPVRLVSFVIDGGLVAFMNWLGSHWSWVGQNYRPDMSFGVSVFLLVFFMYHIDKARLEKTS